MKNHVYRIKATGSVAWGVCASALAVAIVAILATPKITVATAPAGGVGGGASAFVAAASSAVVTSTLGSATVPAILIGVVGGGVGVLNSLRDKYKITEKNEKYIKLEKK